MLAERLHTFLNSVDEENKYKARNCKAPMKGETAKSNDHATEYMDVNLTITTEKPKNKVMWNFKNKSGHEKFKKLTSETNDISDCFDKELSVIEQIDKWRTVLTLNVQNAFNLIQGGS